MQLAESPLSNTGDDIWDRTFNECFWANISTVMWNHSCMFDGNIWVGKDQECSWCGGTEDAEGSEMKFVKVSSPLIKL